MSLRLIHTGMKTLYVRTEKALARQYFGAGSSDPLLLALINSFDPRTLNLRYFTTQHGWQVSKWPDKLGI